MAAHSAYRSTCIIALTGIFLLVVLSLHVRAQLPAVSFYHLKRDVHLFSSSYAAIAEDPYGFIWFGSLDGGGLYRFDGYELRSFLPEPERMTSSIAGSRVTDVYLAQDTLLCVGTSFGFSTLHPVTGRMKNFNNNIESLPDWRIGSTWKFLRDTLHDIVWVATKYGLAKIDGQFQSLRPQVMPIGQAMPEDFTRILQDAADPDILWLGGPGGFFHYSISRGQYDHIDCPQVPGDKLFVSDIVQAPGGLLWIATVEGDVLRYNKASGEWHKYKVPPSVSLPDERRAVYKILGAHDGALWLSTHTGVGILDPGTGKYEAWEYNPDYPDGLLPNGAYRGMMSDRHGRMWIASWHGMQYAKQAFMTPSHAVKNLRVAITALEAAPIYEEKDKPLLYQGRFDLQQEQRDITFQYVLPNPLDPFAVTYQYMLRGFDHDWITTDQRRVRYPRLPGGTYTFVVKAREGESGEWVPETRIEISIPKRLAEYFGFWLVIGLILSGSAVLVYRYLITRAKKEERLKAEFEHQLSEIQMQALRAQMNPHFLFNSLNSIKYFAISKSKDETAAYLSKFAMLVRAILNNSKARTISLQDELDALQLYIEIEHLRLEGKFEYLIDIDSSIHIRQAQIPPMILQPYVENAIWHGLMHKEGKGRLLVQVKDMGHQIQCVIEDNGIGRARSAELRQARLDHKKSVGMQITSDRIALINRIYHIDTQVHVIDLADADGSPLGTRVVINIPLIRDEEE